MRMMLYRKETGHAAGKGILIDPTPGMAAETGTEIET